MIYHAIPVHYIAEKTELQQPEGQFLWATALPFYIGICPTPVKAYLSILYSRVGRGGNASPTDRGETARPSVREFSPKKTNRDREGGTRLVATIRENAARGCSTEKAKAF